MKFTYTIRFAAVLCIGATSMVANAQLQLTCPQDWNALSDLDGPNLDKVILGVKVRDWKKEHVDRMLRKEEECMRSSSFPDSLKQATLDDVRNSIYPGALRSIQERDQRANREVEIAQQTEENARRQVEIEKQRREDDVRAQQAADAEHRKILADQQEVRERNITEQRTREENKRNDKAACEAAYGRVKFPDAWRTAVYLEGVNSVRPFTETICAALRAGAQVRYLAGGLISSTGFEVKSKTRTVQVFVDAKRVPGGDPKDLLLTPVSAKVNNEKMTITNQNFRAFNAELGAAIYNQ